MNLKSEKILKFVSRKLFLEFSKTVFFFTSESPILPPMPTTARNTSPCAANDALERLLKEGAINEELRRKDPAAYKRKLQELIPFKKCCFCGEGFRGWGNSPEPVMNYHEDKCVACNECNRAIVMPHRFRQG